MCSIDLHFHLCMWHIHSCRFGALHFGVSRLQIISCHITRKRFGLDRVVCSDFGNFIISETNFLSSLFYFLLEMMSGHAGVQSFVISVKTNLSLNVLVALLQVSCWCAAGLTVPCLHRQSAHAHQFVSTVCFRHKYILYRMPISYFFYMPACKQLQKPLKRTQQSIAFLGGKATLHHSGECRHTPPLSAAPSLRGLANDMRSLQAVNKVEPIGWKFAFVVLRVARSAGLGYLACGADHSAEG